jgi:selenide,water dikinase
LKLTEWTTCGGCAAKWGGAPLGRLVQDLAGAADLRLLVGLAPFDDAAVYKLTDEVAVVSTTDFFPPLVDEPDDFGAIAAANACSDVFAMGGAVVMALNIAAFPEDFPLETIEQILGSAAATVAAAGGSIAGGHTIRSAEPIFGLAVQGVVHPSRVWSKSGARAGDSLVLSKPLGTGIALAGDEPGAKVAAIAGMRELNRDAAACLQRLPEGHVHAVTDVTGFGLAGHGWEMADRSSACVIFDSAALPLYPSVGLLAGRGLRTGGEDRNRAYLGSNLTVEAGEVYESVVLDPQTSGGLLAAVQPESTPELSGAGWSVVGEVRPGPSSVRVI